MDQEDYERVVPRPNWLNDRLHFYKYVTRSTAKAVLSNRTLRWTTPSLLNDPFDMAFDLHLDIDVEEVRRLALNQLWEAHYGDNPPAPQNTLGHIIEAFRGRFPKLSREKFDEAFGESCDKSLALATGPREAFHEDVRREIRLGKILCLTISPDNMLMWSHYAEQHQGVVLRFRSISEKDSVFGIARPVNYQREMPKLVDNQQLANIMSGCGQLSPADSIQKLVFTKSIDWSYENEWRIFSGFGRDANAPFEDIKFLHDELDGIVFGCRTPDTEKGELSHLVRKINSKAQILNARRAAREFKMDVVP